MSGVSEIVEAFIGRKCVKDLSDYIQSESLVRVATCASSPLAGLSGEISSLRNRNSSATVAPDGYMIERSRFAAFEQRSRDCLLSERIEGFPKPNPSDRRFSDG
jgi:hypothetical protein